MGLLGKLYEAGKEIKAGVDAKNHGYPSPPPNSQPAPKAAAPAAKATRPAIPVDAVPGGSTLREGIRRRQRAMDEL